MPTLLITVDSLRADHLGQYGYERDTMPALDRLAGEGTLFAEAFSNAPYTRVSVPSFQTSRYLAYADPGRFPTVASILEDEGVETAVVGTQTGIGLVGAEFGYGETIDLGRDRYHDRASDRSGAEEALFRVNEVATAVSGWLRRNGFDAVYDALRTPYDRLFGGAQFRHLGYTSAETVTDRAIEWLNGRDGEFFLWIHYMEAHRPYGVHDDDPAYLDGPLPEAEIKRLMKKAGTRPESVTERERRRLLDLYDSDIRYCSRHLDRLFDRLEALDRWGETNVLFSSDHGEEFGEHGRFYHRNYPYDELTHVPLVVRRAPDAAGAGGGGGEGGGVVAGQRELLDLAPTICRLFDVDPSRFGFRGTDLFEGGPRDVIALGQPTENRPAASIRREGWKYVRDDAREQLYDLDADPGERDSVVDERPEIARDLRRRIPDHLLERDVEAVRDPEDEVDRERLASLGYLELKD